GIDAPSKTVTFEAHSVEDPRVPPLSGVVRGQIHFAKFTMTGLDEGKKTHVEMESLTDPRGALPKWIVNFFQKIVMRKWMDVMLKIVARPDIPPSPLVKDFFPPADGRH
ncbi:MAG: START domain-containing protein, partial [Bdellovibrionota bacterium]